MTNALEMTRSERRKWDGLIAEHTHRFGIVGARIERAPVEGLSGEVGEAARAPRTISRHSFSSGAHPGVLAWGANGLELHGR
jgi:hypothetical protein